MTEHDTQTNALALAVWPPANHGRRTTYLRASQGRHRVAPELAARAILAYSDPGDLVVDPACGIGTVLVEAIHTGRRAIGVEADRGRAALATANISHARQQGAPGRAAVIEGEPAELPRLIAKANPILNASAHTGQVRRHPAGSSQLILTAAKPATAQLAAWTSVLAPGGFLLLVHVRPTGRQRPGLGPTVAAAEQAGLEYWQHVIALQANQGSELLHTDVLAFRKPYRDTTPDVAAVGARVPAGKAVAA